MKKSFKKLTAALMAVASLAVGVTGIGASAADVTTPVFPEITEEYQGPETDIIFGGGAHAKAYADSTQINLTTVAQSSTKSAGVQVIAVTAEKYNGNYLVHTHVGEVSYNTNGTGIAYVGANHTANGYSQGTARYVG